MSTCKIRPGVIFKLLKRQPEILLESFKESLPVKISTDSPNAGGVITEANLEKNLNRETAITTPEICFASNKGLERISEKNKIIFPYGCKSLKEFNEKCKSPWTCTSAADLYLLQITKEGIFLRDGISLKSSTSSSTNFVYMHNDPNGEIHDALVLNKRQLIGQILFILYDDNELLCCSFDKCLTEITSLFKKNTTNKGGMVFHGRDCKLSLTKPEGKNRQLLKIINRAGKKKKISSDGDLAATSFTRGLMLDKGFLEVLIREKIVDVILRKNLEKTSAEEHDFENRYPQLITNGGNK